jgi:exosortase
MPMSPASQADQAPSGARASVGRAAALPSIDPGVLLGHFRRFWFVWLGALCVALPTFSSVARISWSTEQGAHGPIVLATGIWLVMLLWDDARASARPGNITIAVLWQVAMLVLYILSRVTGILEIEGFVMYGALVATLYAFIGGTSLRIMWFPLVYFLFLFPPPDQMVWAVTQPLKLGISAGVVNLLDIFGYPVGRSGVTIQVDRYELLVAAACAGLNSLISLSAIGLFYVYIRHNANWRYALLLMVAIVPVAVLANFMRVLLLVLITYYFGDAAAQGFLHNFAGVTMFAVAVLGIFGVDALASPLRERLGRGAAA